MEGKPVALAPPGYTVISVPASGTILCRGPDRKVAMCAPGADPKPIPNLAPADFVLAVSPDGRSLFLSPAANSLLRTSVERLEISTGRRQPYLDLKPQDTSGLVRMSPPVLSLDGTTYFYSVRRVFTELFVVDGLR